MSYFRNFKSKPSERWTEKYHIFVIVSLNCTLRYAAHHSKSCQSKPDFFSATIHSSGGSSVTLKNTSISASLHPPDKVLLPIKQLHVSTGYMWTCINSYAHTITHTHTRIYTHIHTEAREQRELHWHLGSDIFQMAFCLWLNPHSLSMNPVTLSSAFWATS